MSFFKNSVLAFIIRVKNLTLSEIFIVLFIIFIASVVSYTIYTKKELDPSEPIFEVQNNVFSAEDMIVPPNEDSTAEVGLEKLTTLDRRLADAETDAIKLNLSFKKGLALITQNNRTGESSLEAQQEARQLFASVYENTKDNPELKTLNESALWGFLFHFVSTSNGDIALILNDMPEDIKLTYFSDIEDSPTPKKILADMVTLVDDAERFSRLRNDKGFNSYSAMLKAEYLDSFAEEFTEDEREHLIASIKNDIFEYEMGIEITTRDTVDTLRTTSIMPTQIAFARFVVKQVQDSNSVDIQDLTDIYKQIHAIEGIDGFGRAIILSRITFYELSAQNRFGATEEQISTTVQQLEALRTKYPDLSIILKRMLNDRLSPERQWNRTNKDLTVLAETSPSFTTFLSVIGVGN